MHAGLLLKSAFTVVLKEVLVVLIVLVFCLSQYLRVQVATHSLYRWLLGGIVEAIASILLFFLFHTIETAYKLRMLIIIMIDQIISSANKVNDTIKIRRYIRWLFSGV